MSETGEVAVEETEEEKLARYQAIVDRRMKEDPEKFYSELTDLVEVLKEKYTPKSLNDVELMHLASGSGRKEGHKPKNFDTPGGEFEAFLSSREKIEAE